MRFVIIGIICICGPVVARRETRKIQCFKKLDQYSKKIELPVTYCKDKIKIFEAEQEKLDKPHSRQQLENRKAELQKELLKTYKKYDVDKDLVITETELRNGTLRNLGYNKSEVEEMLKNGELPSEQLQDMLKTFDYVFEDKKIRFYKLKLKQLNFLKCTSDIFKSFLPPDCPYDPPIDFDQWFGALQICPLEDFSKYVTKLCRDTLSTLQWQVSPKGTRPITKLFLKEGNTFFALIDIVMEGGGTHGIALAGFTYTLEQLNIRFKNIAGTSAGAINAAFLAASGQIHEEKTHAAFAPLSDNLFEQFINPYPAVKKKEDLDSEGWLAWIDKALGYSAYCLAWIDETWDYWAYWPLRWLKGLGGWAYWPLRWLKGLSGWAYWPLSWLKGLSGWDYWPLKWLKGLGEWVYSLLRCLKGLGEWVYWLLGWLKGVGGETDPTKALKFATQEVLDYLADDDMEKEDQSVFIKKNLRSVLTTLRMINETKGLVDGTGFRDWFTKKLNETSGNCSTIKKLDRDCQGKIDVSKLWVFNDSSKELEELTRYIANDTNYTEFTRKPKLVIISADITTQSRVLFPEHAAAYFAQVEDVELGKLVQASMSVPVLFEPLKLKIPCGRNGTWTVDYGLKRLKDKKETAGLAPDEETEFECLQAWGNEIQYRGVLPNSSVFMDGGIVSNFAYDVLHYKGDHVIVKPVIGVRLKPFLFKPPSGDFGDMGFLQTMSSMFDTSRNFADNQFQKMNSFTRVAVAHIPVPDYIHWLGFDMRTYEKNVLFKEGVTEAIGFVMKFDWKAYKKARLEEFAHEEERKEYSKQKEEREEL